MTILVLGNVPSEARPLGGFSAGSRGARTYSAPPSTSTAPSVAPIQRSMTQATPSRGLGSSGSLFGGGGLFGRFAGGLLGAGLLGMLFGYGLFGGLGGFASIIGLLFQVLIIVIVARLIYAWWQRRNIGARPAYAGSNATAGYGFGHPAAANVANTAFVGEPIRIGKSDYDAFERLLGEIQTAYSAENLPALRSTVTPEMLSYFSEDLAANASRSLVNRVTDVKLMKGDLAEAWREGRNDFVSVAMRYGLKDNMVERGSGRIVEGGRDGEVTEVWTFARAQGGNWLLSAIQQT
jgi:predicted lipid-binding transport protein (Tim44 family)